MSGSFSSVGRLVLEREFERGHRAAYSSYSVSMASALAAAQRCCAMASGDMAREACNRSLSQRSARPHASLRPSPLGSQPALGLAVPVTHRYKCSTNLGRGELPSVIQPRTHAASLVRDQLTCWPPMPPCKIPRLISSMTWLRPHSPR